MARNWLLVLKFQLVWSPGYSVIPSPKPLDLISVRKSLINEIEEHGVLFLVKTAVTFCSSKYSNNYFRKWKKNNLYPTFQISLKFYLTTIATNLAWTSVLISLSSQVVCLYCFNVFEIPPYNRSTVRPRRFSCSVYFHIG